MEIVKGGPEDVKALGKLYDELNDYLATGKNYPGWIKGIYPTEEDAENGVKDNALYIIKDKETIAGSFILRHKQDSQYNDIDWGKGCNDFTEDEVLVINTFALNPQYLYKGLGKEALKFMIDTAKSNGDKAIRLDVFEGNAPAIKLYEGFGFNHIADADLGYKCHGLDSFRLYQLALK